MPTYAGQVCDWVRLKKARQRKNTKDEEIFDLANEAAVQIAEAIPENNYWAFSAYTLIIPEILSYLGACALPQSDLSTPIWNYSDAALQSVTGLSQLFDSKTHRPWVTKTKGLINLASGIQLAILTGIGATTLGPLAFSAGTGVSFLLTLDEGIRHIRKLMSAEYFLVDSLAELDKARNLIIEKEMTIVKLRYLLDSDPKSRSAKLALNFANKSLEALQKKSALIEEQLKARFVLEVLEPPKNKQSSFVRFLESIDPSSKDCPYKTESCRKFLTDLKGGENHPELEAAKKIDAETKKKIRLAALTSISNSMVWGIAFAGTLLICLPGMQPVGLGLIIAASALFLLKNSGKLTAKAATAANSFFKPKPPITLSTEDLTEKEGESHVPLKDTNH